jgi:hypothetical protein
MTRLRAKDIENGVAWRTAQPARPIGASDTERERERASARQNCAGQSLVQSAVSIMRGMLQPLSVTATASKECIAGDVSEAALSGELSTSDFNPIYKSCNQILSKDCRRVHVSKPSRRELRLTRSTGKAAQVG